MLTTYFRHNHYTAGQIPLRNSCLPGHDVITSKSGEDEITVHSIWLCLYKGQRWAQLCICFDVVFYTVFTNITDKSPLASV